MKELLINTDSCPSLRVYLLLEDGRLVIDVAQSDGQHALSGLLRGALVRQHEGQPVCVLRLAVKTVRSDVGPDQTLVAVDGEVVGPRVAGAVHDVGDGEHHRAVVGIVYVFRLNQHHRGPCRRTARQSFGS